MAIWYPWVMMAALLGALVLKLALTYYIPFFQQVDLTGLVCGLALFFGLWSYYRGARFGRPLMIPWGMLICMGIIAILLLAGLAWTTAPSYGLRKAVRFAGMSIPFLILPSFYVRAKQDGHAMIRMVILVGIATAVMLVLMPKSYLTEQVFGRHYQRGTVLGASPGVPAQVIAIGILTLLAAFGIKGSASRLFRYSALIALPLSLAAILMSGSRGTFMGLFCTGLIAPLFFGRKDRARGLLLVTLLMPVVLVIVFTRIADTGLISTERWLDFFERRGLTVETRTPHWSFVITHWWSRPVLGHGPGSFAMDWMNIDEPLCPHNIILEALYETGLVGMAALLFLFYFVARTALRGLREISGDNPRDRLLVIGPLLMVLLMAARAMTSTDLEGMRWLYLCCGLLHANVSHLAYSNREAALAGTMRWPDQPRLAYPPSQTALVKY